MNGALAVQVGFDASGLEGLHMHHIVVNTWEHGVDSEQVRPSDLTIGSYAR